jgi:thiamine pyrophosphokinase
MAASSGVVPERNVGDADSCSEAVLEELRKRDVPLCSIFGEEWTDLQLAFLEARHRFGVTFVFL